MTGELVLQRRFRITKTTESPTAVIVVFHRRAVPAPRVRGAAPQPVIPNPKVKILRTHGKLRFYWMILPWPTDASKQQFEAEALRQWEDQREPTVTAGVKPAGVRGRN